MKDHFFKDARVLFGACTILVLISAISVRLWSVSHPTEQVMETVPKDTSGLPAFTSAAFETGDALSSLGPEWTLVRQDIIGDKNIVVLPGTRASRETLVRLIGTSSTLLVTEIFIDDAGSLRVALEDKDVQKITVGGRVGYLIHPPSYSGESAFMIVGSSSALVLQYGEESFQNMMDWPTEVPAAIQSYIQVVPVR